LGNKGKSRGLVRTPSNEKEKPGSSQSIRVEGEPIEIDLDTSVDLSMDLTMDTSMDVDLDLDTFDHDHDKNNKEEEEDVFAATPSAKISFTAGLANPASLTSGLTPTSTPTASKPKGFTPLVPKPKPSLISGPSGGISKTSVGAGSSSPLSELEDLPETEISKSISTSKGATTPGAKVPNARSDDVAMDMMGDEEEDSPIKVTVSLVLIPFPEE
jgi:hypothetical protein